MDRILATSLKNPPRPSPVGYFGRLLSTIWCDLSTLLWLLALLTLNLQGEENKLEKKVCSRGHSVLYEVFWQVVFKCNRLQLVNPDKKR